MTAQQQIETENLPALPEITPEQWPAIYEGGDYLSNFIQRVRDEVGNEVPDLSTKKGRARVASLAAQVSKAKAAVEKPGRDYLRDIKAKVKPIEENIREFVRAMDDLRDQVRKPLTDWEEREKARVEKHQTKIEMIKNLSGCIDGLSSHTLREKLAASELFEPAEFEEFEGEAATALLLTQKTLRDALAKREAFEKEQAEQEAERQRLAEERRQIELEKAKEEGKKEAAAEFVQERTQLVQQTVALTMQVQEAKTEVVAVTKSAEKQIDSAAQAAAEAERKRIAAEDAAKAAEEKRRQEDQEHRAAINRAALADLMALELDEATAKRVLIGIIQGKVANVSVRY